MPLCRFARPAALLMLALVARACGREIGPDAGYDVTYFEFDGPPFITPPAAREALARLTR